MSTSIIPGPNVFRAISGSLFSSPINWSRGVVPTGSDVAMIADNCTIDISRTIGSLVVRAPFTASINTGLTLLVNDIIDVKGHLSCSGAPNIISAAKKNNINSFSPGNSTFTYSGENQNVPGLTYNNLTISNIGTKTLIGHTTLNGNFNQSGNASVFSTFEMGSYNFFVNGTTTLTGQQNFASNSFKKSGPGNITFVGTLYNTGNNSNLLDFSGNPNVECRGGIYIGPYGWGAFNSGTGIWTFSINNQEIFGSYNVTNFSGPVLISGPITLTITSGGGVSLYVNILNSINGNNANSKLLVGGGSTQVAYLGIGTTTPIMSTGIFDFTTSTLAGVSIRMATAYSIPYNNFQHLEVANSGKKSLSANTTIQQTLFINCEFDAVTYDLTINGQTAMYAGGSSIFRKTGAGTITFGGLLQAASAKTTIDFSGNPNVEFKNGFTQGSVDYTTFNSGTGVWKFSTNNQSLGGLFLNNTLNCQILISGGITLTLLSQFNGGPIFTNTINGDNAASKLLMSVSSILTHQNATQPMTTGILDTSTNLNTWIYGSGSQDIKGGTYRNLTLNGGGTKTLQGNVSVQNTYTLTSPATLNNNGFTLTNP